MRRVLASAVLVAFLPTANAQDKGKADFSANAEARARYFWMQNPGGSKDSLSNRNMANGRFKMNFGYKANEKISATATLLHNTNFGQDTNANDIVAQDHATDTEDGLNVNQAFMTWMSSDDLKFNVGRMNYQVADGALIGINDWENVPYSFEGVRAMWEAEFGKFDFVLFKVRNIVVTGGNSAASGDPEQNMYGINFDLKTTPEWLKGLNVHFFKNNGDSLDSGATGTGKVMDTTNGLDVMRYGLMGHLGFGDFEVKAWYEGQGGKVKNVNAGTKTDVDYAGNMMQAEVAYNAAGFMQSRFHFMYHKDSGDKSGTDTKFETYDSYFTQKHNSAGAMDLFGWGNLTFMQLGWTMKPQDKTTVGLQYTMLSKTEKTDSFVPGTFGGPATDTKSLAAANTNGNNSKLGDEIDVWATHSYDANLSTTLRLGYFKPGDHFEGTPKATDAIMHVMVEGKATF